MHNNSLQYKPSTAKDVYRKFFSNLLASAFVLRVNVRPCIPSVQQVFSMCCFQMRFVFTNGTFLPFYELLFCFNVPFRQNPSVT